MDAVVDELVNIWGWLSFFIYYLGLNFSLTGREWSMLIGVGKARGENLAHLKYLIKIYLFAMD